jgi:hypothetical protein
MMAIMALAWLLAGVASAQQPPVHYQHNEALPPGAIGGAQLQRGGPLPGYFQPVEIKAPTGVLISPAVENQFDRPRAAPLKLGLLIGAVYRLRVTNIPQAEGLEVYPTVEIIDRTYPPSGQELRFPIPVVLTAEDLRLALEGKFVTRVIYLEDPRNALPAHVQEPGQQWFEAAPGQDPLAVADGLGRPVAILRIGARLPDPAPDAFFFYGSPPFRLFAAGPESTTTAKKESVPPAKTASRVRNLPPPPSSKQR